MIAHIIAAYMVIVGENTLNERNYLAVLKKMAKELGLEECVHFAEWRAILRKFSGS